jgi:ABC-2 type transport system ATP-binding protein
MATILEVRNLVKKYDTVVAVDGVSFAIRPGVCFGLLGPNGAGKTTTIEVIEDVIPPTSGEILYKGKPRSPSFREEVGIQFQSTALLNLLTVRETLQTFQSLFTKTNTIEELVELCRLGEFLDQYNDKILGEFLDQYNDKISGGQRQRFLLALALINRPELLFLDEPSTGLDPQARRNLWDLIQGIKAEGKTLILTTHYMEEAQHLCDEVAIMDYGKIIAQGSPDELIRQHSRGITVVLPRKRYALKANSFPLPVREVKDTIEIKTDDVNQCLEQLLSHDVDLSDITVRSPNLESVFLNLTGRKLRE